MFDTIIDLISQTEGMEWLATAGLPLQIAVIIVGFLIVVAGIFSIVASIFLFTSYVKYNHTKASCGMTGQDVARTILDKNGLENIKVKCTGSIIFGNSYSHYFKKVRLRRLTWKKDSVTSLAMAAQKSSLAVLDKEGDQDMKTRIILTPFIYFGPVMCIPLILLGIILDVLLFNFAGIVSIIFVALGLLSYLASFIMSILVLKTEKKAQEKAYEILEKEGLANQEELQMMKDLFRLYNIEYVVDMVIALLELIMRILQIVGYLKGSSSSSNN